MKRLGVVLAVLLLALFPAVALADDMYGLYGPMYEWDDDVWEASGEWSDEQWDEYWQGEQEASDLVRRDHAREAKLELGCPDPDGLNVMLNDAFLLFEGAKPRNEQSGFYLPLKAFFAAAGLTAEFSYDPQSRSVTVTRAEGGTILFTADDSVILVTSADEEPWELFAYDEPLLWDGHMYVEEWDLCRILGWDSYFDYSNDILYIVDPEPLIEALDSKFTILNRLLANSVSFDLDLEKSYQFSGNIALSGFLYGEGKNDGVSATLNYSGLRKGLDIEIDLAVQLDLKDMQDSIFSGLDKEAWSMIKAIDAGKGRLIMNSEEEVFYAQSNLLPLVDERYSPTEWLKLDYPAQELLELLADPAALLQAEGISLGRLIYESSNGYSYSERDIYSRTQKNAKLWQDLLGDENFSVTSRGGYDVFSLSLKNKPIPGLSDSGGGLLSLLGLFDYSAAEEAAGFSATLSFREKAGRLEDLEIKVAAKTPGIIPVTYTFDFSFSSLKRKCLMEINGRYLGKLLFSAEYEAKPSEKLPAAAPPPGSRVVESPEMEPLSGIRLLKFARN